MHTFSIDRDTGPDELRAIVAFCQTLLGTSAIASVTLTNGHAPEPLPVFGLSTVPPVTEALDDEIPNHAPPGVTIDGDGLPWDERIHSANKSMTDGGKWRKKKGVDAATVASVEAGLRSMMAVPMNRMADAVPPIPQPPAAPVTMPGFPAAPVAPIVATVAPPIPQPPAAPTVAPPIPQPPAPTPEPVPAPVAADPDKPTTFPAFMMRVATLMGSQRIGQDHVNAACAAHGISQVPALIQRPDLIPAVNQSIDNMLAGGQP